MRVLHREILVQNVLHVQAEKRPYTIKQRIVKKHPLCIKAHTEQPWGHRPRLSPQEPESILLL